MVLNQGSKNMKQYQDITVLPDAVIGLNFLWEKLYRDLHLALVSISEQRPITAEGQKEKPKMSKVGVAFPDYRHNTKTKDISLGRKLRLLAKNQQELEKLDIQAALSRLSDYIHITSIKDIDPAKVTGQAYLKGII